MKLGLRVLIGIGIAAVTLMAGAPRVYALTCSSSVPGTPFPCLFSIDYNQWWQKQDFTRSQKSFLENDFYQGKIVEEFWTGALEPTLQGMTAQIVAARYYATGTVGGMMDGLATNATMGELQRRAALAYRDYTPGEQLCRFGTNARSLAATAQQAERVQVALNQKMEARFLHKQGGPTGGGSGSERLARFSQYQKLYCDPGDNNGQMKNLCYPNQAGPTAPPERFNRDIDITRTLMMPRTLNLDFADQNLTKDEEDILALSRNLYADELMDTVPPAMFQDTPGDPNRAAYLDVRQLVAMRGVAQNSFNALVASKAKGTGSAQPFMAAVLQEMGMSAPEASQMLDQSTGTPSYDAQMEVLTKTLYQNPNFYAHLVDKPANVKRILAAMEAIDLTQQRDTYESLERQELLLSLLLELEIRSEQARVQSDVIEAAKP